jgi:hypothetical protein
VAIVSSLFHLLLAKEEFQTFSVTRSSGSIDREKLPYLCLVYDTLLTTFTVFRVSPPSAVTQPLTNK